MLCDQLKYIRKANKFTQQQIADALNIERSTYASYETGRNRPDVNLLSAFADIFSVSIDFIVSLDTSVPLSDVNEKYKKSKDSKNQLVLSQLNSDEKNIIAYFRHCSYEEKQEILNIISRKK